MGPTGNLKWLQTINNANVGYHYYMYNDYPIFNIAALNTNAICLAFSFSSNSLSIGTDTYSSQYYDCLIAQIDSMGNYIWSKTISGNQGTGLIDIAVNKNNYIYVLGVSSSTILSTSNYSIINSNPVSNLFFTAFDAQGQDYGLIMSRRTHTITNNYIEPYSISMDSNNNGYLVGYLNSDLICGTQSITSSPQNNFFLSKIKSSNALGIKNQVETSDDLNVYPNPAKSSINIDSRAFKNADIKIINTFGQVVYQKTKADLTESLDFSYLSAGIYFVNIQNKISQKTIKVIKE
jgi:hypothetical protein